MMVITIVTKMFVYNNRIYRQYGNSIIEFVDTTPEAEYSEFVYRRHICDLSHAWDVSHYVANNMLFVVFRTIEKPERGVCEIFDLSKEGECFTGMLTLPATLYGFGENINVHGNLLIVDDPHKIAYDCSVYDIQTLKKLSSIPQTNNTQSPSMVFKNYMFVCTEDKKMHMQLHMYDLRTGKELKYISLGSSGTTQLFPFRLLEFKGFIYFFCFRFIVRVNIITEEVVRKTFAPHHRVDLDKIKSIDDCHVYHDDVLYVMARDKSYIRDLYSGSLGDIFSSASDIVPAYHRYSFEIHVVYILDVCYYRNLMVIDYGSFALEVRLDIKSSKEKHLYSDVWFEYDSYYRITGDKDEHGFSKIIRFNVDIIPGTWSTNDIWNTFNMTKGLLSDPNYDALKRSCYKRNNFSRLEKFASYVRCPRAYVQLMSDASLLREKKRVDVNLMVLKALIRADSPDDVCQDIFTFDLQRREKIGTNDLLLRIIASFLN